MSWFVRSALVLRVVFLNQRVAFVSRRDGTG
jgi:hypothetical protein